MGGGNGGEKVEFGGEKRDSNFFCWMKMNRFDTNFKMERSKKQIMAKKGRKMPKTFFESFLVEIGNLSNLANWIKNHYFLYCFLYLIIKKPYKK